ncbi:restriction endonuclease [Raoultella terrigena]|uniref:restriction endonuclease n=1 Tax=Raoultella terrigena TaxID=577 RepID=UPI0005F842DA|nr:restriction endonuclease [Raoultella terrigena]
MKLTPLDLKNFKKIFENPLQSGYVLNFSDKTMREFFESELHIDIDNLKYKDEGTSKLKRVISFIKKNEQITVLAVVNKLWDYRKTLNDFPITYQDDAIFNNLISKLKVSGEQSITDIITASPTRINNQHLLDKLEFLKEKKPQERGYGFEGWLNELFRAFNLAPREPFKIAGEQIDGSFQLNHQTYLVEAKWHQVKTGNRDLHVFQGKIDQKSKWTRGVFISWSGFTREGLNAWGKSKSVICVSGKDLYLMLKHDINFCELIEKKEIISSEDGDYYVSIDKLYPNLRNFKINT